MNQQQKINALRAAPKKVQQMTEGSRPFLLKLSVAGPLSAIEHSRV